MSARLISRDTALPTSSIYHHFGSMEQLLQSAQAHARDAAQAWCEARIAEISTWPSGGGPESLARILAVFLDDWVQENRELAFAWNQCHLLAQRDAAYLPAIDAWRQTWARFWNEACDRAGLAEHAGATSHIFEATGQMHLIRWNRTIDRAALDEFCTGWGKWLSGSLAEEGPWRRHAREIALASAPELSAPNGVAAMIADAAADVVEDLGIAALTHRAVAAGAGVTLGVVSYNYRTSADLVRAAFDAIYRRLTAPILDKPAHPTDRGEMLAAWADFSSQPRRLAAMEELILAVARDPGLRDFGPQLRYLRGRSSSLQLALQLGPEARISPLDAALYSSMVSGQRRALIGLPEADIHAGLDAADALVAGLRKTD